MMIDGWRKGEERYLSNIVGGRPPGVVSIRSPRGSWRWISEIWRSGPSSDQ
jgi:hypothetical protein